MSRTFNPARSPWQRRPRSSGSPRLGIVAVLLIGGLVLLNQGKAPLPKGEIAYASTFTGNFELHLMKPNGEYLARLTDRAGQDSEPHWSWDGQRVVFSGQDGITLDAFIAEFPGVDNLGLLEEVSLTDALELADDYGPELSWECARRNPQSCTEMVAFHSDADGDYDLYVMEADGAPIFQVTNDPADDRWPTWSPDGERLAFMSDRDGEYFDIYVVEIRSGEVQRYTTSEFSDDAWPEWSPDGRTIAWISGDTGWYRIWLMDAVCTPECGPNKRLLIPLSTGQEQKVNEFDPAWSPDSNWIAFTSYRDPTSDNPLQKVQFDFEIFIVRTDGSDMQQLTFNELVDDLTPAWRPEAR